MINVIVSFDVQTGKGDALCKWLEGALVNTRAHPGCKRATLNKNIEDGDGPILIEEWESADTHKAFVEHLVSSGAMEQAMAFLNGPPQTRYYSTAA